MLGEAKKLIQSKRLEEARDLLRQIETKGLGGSDARTSLGLPRRLQSARLKLAKAEGDAMSKIAYQFHLVPPPQTLARHAGFSAAERQKMVDLSRVDVPRCIHQIWLGPRPAPSTVAAWADHAALHGYQYKLWREADLVQSGYDRSPAMRHMLEDGDFPGAVDVVRYMILRDLGGIYLDCDWYPARSTKTFHHTLPLTGLGVFAEDIPRNTGTGSTLFANSFIATPPDHPVFAKLCEILPSVVDELGDAPAWWSTGPLVFTILARSGPVSLADMAFATRSMPAGTPLDEVEALAEEMEATESAGLMIAWKPW
jgi:mannosyltransferase OCH1-like enzyme